MSVRHAAAINRAIGAPISADPSDRDLLRRFAVGRDEEAFAELVRRHGPLVFGVCRRVLGDRAVAEDAFQATFLALARRASADGWRESVASWLYTVAHRAATRLRATTRRHQVVPPRPRPAGPVDPADEVCLRDALAALDEELARLPARLREPVVLCCLHGYARDEAARILDVSTPALKRRLERGRAALAARLRRRGLGLPAALGAALWANSVGAAPPGLIETAARLPFAPVSPAVVSLAGQLTRGLAPWRFSLVATVLFAGLAALSFAAATSGDPPAPSPSAVREPESPVPKVAQADRHGDPLPPGAVARLGTIRQRAPQAHIAVTADGKQIVAVDPTLVVRRFDAATGVLQDTRTLPETPSTFVIALSPTGRRLASVHWGPGGRGGESTAVVWDLDRGARIETLTLAESLGWVEGIAFSPDEQQVGLVLEAPDTGAEEVRLWELRSRQVRTLHRQEKLPRERYADSAVRFSPDGKYVAAWLRDRRLRCWELATDKLRWEQLNGYSSIFFFSPDGRWVMTRDVERLDAATGKPAPWPHPAPGKRLEPLGPSPDGRVLAMRSVDCGVMFWDPATGKVVHQIVYPGRRGDSPITTISELPHDYAFTPDGTGFVWRAGPLQRWDLRTGKPVFADTRAAGHADAVTRVVFSPDGRRLASLAGFHESRARVWDVAAATTSHEFPTTYSSHLAFGPGGHLFALAEGVGKAALDEWDTGTGRKVRGYELTDPKEFVRSTEAAEIHIAPARVTVLTMKNGQAGEECVLTAWDTRTGKTLRHERVGWGPESALTPDGTGVVAVDSSSRRVQHLAVDSGELRVAFRFDPPWPTRQQGESRHAWSKRIAVSPDGRFVAVTVTLSDQRTGLYDTADVFIGDAMTGRQLAHFPRKGDIELAFSPDSRVLATADGDGLRLWETATWKLAGTVPPPAGTSADVRRPWATALAVSPDGRLVATGHPDGTVLLWDATLGHARRPVGADEAGRLWDDLAAEAANRAYPAGWRLTGAPGVAVGLIRDRLKPVTPVPADEVRQLVAGLGAAEFETREAAEQKLRGYGERVTAALREALKDGLSAEQRRRIEFLLVPSASGPLATGEMLRGVRAVGVLERIGSPDAHRVLESLAAGAPDARLTREAKAALDRLGRR